MAGVRVNPSNPARSREGPHRGVSSRVIDVDYSCLPGFIIPAKGTMRKPGLMAGSHASPSSIPPHLKAGNLHFLFPSRASLVPQAHLGLLGLLACRYVSRMGAGDVGPSEYKEGREMDELG